ncbi:MAG TPA: hypothetical protein VFI31_12960 [Pirellulales bacterium]|nr:hypothetical protein [Pirellulales bacterium]
MTHAARFARRGRRILFVALSGFVCLQLGMSVLMDDWLPSLHDPEYGAKLRLLEERLAERPDRALTLVLGSSRCGLGLNPESFPQRNVADGREQLVFNFGITGCGPIQELQLFQRLLRHGVKPQRLLIEIHPLLFHQENGIGEECWIEPRRMDWRDVALVKNYVYDPRSFVWRWIRSRLAPWYSNRFLILNHFARTWLDQRQQFQPWSGLTDYGWLPFGAKSVTPEEYRRGADNAKREYSAMLDSFRVTESADRALRTLLGHCREQGIEVALFVMPEGSEFRSHYTPEARGRINDYLVEVSRQCNLPVYDATQWCDDHEFWDSHHLLRHGAERFSERFGRQAFADFLARSSANRLR